YLATGSSKLLGTTWWSGTALNQVLLNPSFAPLHSDLYYRLMKALATYRPVWEAFIAGGIVYTLLVEISFPFLVWNRQTRWFMVCCSVGLHTGIGLSMGLTTFSLMMMVLVLCFVPPEQIRALLAGLRRTAAGLLARRAGR